MTDENFEYDETDEDDLEAILAEAQSAGDEVPVDLSEAQEFKPLPEGGGSGPDGMYLLRVKDSKAGPGIKTNAGDPAWKVKFVVIDPNADRKAVIGRTMPLRGAGAGFAKEAAEALGHPLGDPPKLRPSAYINEQCWAVLEISEKNADFNNVGKMKPYTGASYEDALVGEDDD